MNQNITATWVTATTGKTSPDFNHTVDVVYGSVCFLCFLVGTLGNLVSFLYFKSKKRDISSVLYMMITANDIMVSITVIPIGISLWTGRKPGTLFGNSYGCAAWVYLWQISVSTSIFLVICLSMTRTIALVRPFQRLRLRNLLIAVALNLVFQLTLRIGFHFSDGSELRFTPYSAQCDLQFMDIPNESEAFITLAISLKLTYIAPALVVGTSSIVSVVLLTRKNENLQNRELQHSRNRATITILLFALLYGVCNLPIVVDYILMAYSLFLDNLEWYSDLYGFESINFYYTIAKQTLLIAVNSAVNPVLYLWRMPPLRHFIKRMLRMNREIERHQIIVTQRENGEKIMCHSIPPDPAVAVAMETSTSLMRDSSAL
jgi:hypothetical protein